MMTIEPGSPILASDVLPLTYMAPGRVCFTWDDGYDSHYDIAIEAAKRGQKHTFFVNSDHLDGNGFLTSGELQNIDAMGHEIGSHGVTHVDVTLLSDSTRRTMWDNDIAALESVIGSGKVTSYAYPYGTRNTTTDAQAYLTFDRIRGVSYEGGNGTPPFIIPMSSSSLFLAGGMDYSPSVQASHAHIMSLIELASRSPVIVILYGHDVADVNMYRVLAAMDYAATLRIPCLAYGDILSDACNLRDPGFEDATLARWPVVRSAGGTGIAESVVDAPMAGFPGSRSLRLAQTVDTQFIYVSQRIAIETPSIPHTISGRYRLTKTSGAGSVTARLQGQRMNGEDTSSSSYTFIESASWAPFTFDFTPTATSTNVRLDFLMNNYAGELFVDHVHVGPRVFGSFG